MNNNVVNLSVIPTEDLNHLKEQLDAIKNALTKKKEEDLSSDYIESKSIPKILGISQKTWQTYRDKGTIPFIQFGSKIWVKRIDIEAFLNNHYISKKS